MITSPQTIQEQVGGLVDTFEPVDPATVAEQRAEADRLCEAVRRNAQNG